ncbi:MAG: hypothetical protein AAGH41_09025 [Pseudomonadota bacterium]
MAAELTKTRDRKEAFLSDLALHGSVARACRATGVARSVAYHWRASDPAVAEAWDNAMVIRLDEIRDEVVEKALVATGRIVEENVFDDQGNPVWDAEADDFATVRRLVDYDPQILKSLVNKTLVSADGRNAPSVQANVQVNLTTQERPAVVRRAERPSWARHADAEAEFIDAEIVEDTHTEDLDGHPLLA